MSRVTSEYETMGREGTLRVSIRRTGRILLVAAVLALFLAPLLPLPAEACSCAMPGDIRAWVDESEAAFVGTMIEKRDAGQGQEFGPESIYVFEVEEWVKGDLGDVIEVRSASDGGGCGFEFWDEEMRTGAILREEGGELHGSLCEQVDANVLLAAMAEPTPSATGVGYLLSGNGWNSLRLTVLDDSGHHVTDLEPPGQVWAGTQQLEVCPGGERMLQLTGTDVVVWILETHEIWAIHDISGIGEASWPDDISCRDPEAATIWLLAGREGGSRLVEVPGLSVISELPGTTGVIGTDYVITQIDHEGDLVRVDVTSGEQVQMTETPEGELRSISTAPHPSQPKIAILETHFAERGPVTATLSVVDLAGEVTAHYDIPGEAYQPTWLDEHRIAVQAYDHDDWTDSIGFVFDTETGETVEIAGWNAQHVVADGDVLFGVDGGDIVTTDLTDGSVETLVTLASQSAGPLVLLEDAPAIDPVSPITTAGVDATTPPLLAPEAEGEDGVANSIRWVAGAAVAGFAGLLIWLTLGSPRRNEVD